jgi:hypothetical protein
VSQVLQHVEPARETSDPGRPLFFEKHVGAASAPLPPSYRPRQPEKTVLQTMLAEARARTDHKHVGTPEGTISRCADPVLPEHPG